MAGLHLRTKFANMKDNIRESLSQSKGGLSPVEDVEDFPITESFVIPKVNKPDQRLLPLNNPHRESEVLESISQDYYSDEPDFDPSLHELKKLPAELDINAINVERKAMKEQVSVVSKRISDLILEKHPSYSAELSKVAGIQKSLLLAYDVCLTARGSLSSSRSIVTESGIRLLGHYRKLGHLKELLRELETIKTLQETEYRLRELLQDGHYIQAIQLCLKCQEATTTYRHYSCIGEMSGKLERLLASMEVELSAVGTSLVLAFHPDKFQQLATAYQLLNGHKLNGAWVVEQTLCGLERAAKSLMLERGAKREAEPDLDALQLRQMAQSLESDEVGECARELCALLWRIFASYHAAIRYHRDLGPVLSLGVVGEEGGEYESLVEGLGLVWRAGAEQVNAFLAGAPVGGLQFPAFLRLLAVAKEFRDLGRRHFAAESEELAATLAAIARAYFKTYHRSRMEELRAYLDAEAWELCPLPPNFALTKLPEFFFLRKMESNVESPSGDEGFVPLYAESGNPFQATLSDPSSPTAEETDDDSETDEALRQDFVDEGGLKREAEKTVEWRPAVEMKSNLQCNTSLNLLRLFGRYLNLASLLPSMGFDALAGLSHLFDYYFYAVTQFFGSDGVERGLVLVDPRLAAALQGFTAKYASGGKVGEVKAVGMAQSESLFALPARIVAVESLVYLATQLRHLQPRLQALLSSDHQVFLHTFFTQTVGVVELVRDMVYGCVGTRAVNFTYLHHAITNDVNWAVGELMSQHSTYIDYLVQDLGRFGEEVERVGRAMPFPLEAYQSLWRTAIGSVFHALVHGYSRAKKCSTEGRALMQLDFQQLLRHIHTLTTLRPVPLRDYVDQYIKGYYVPENEIENWINAHPEYGQAEIGGLLQVASHISRKTRTRLAQSP